MIALDASVLLALINSKDKHNLLARALTQSYMRPYLVHEINLAEVLVHAAHLGKQEVILNRLRLVMSVAGSSGEAGALRLAQLRATTSLRLPDCCALDAAREAGVALATFDRKLAEKARALGLEVVPA
jgi:predicted nucleic acid-binding protein